MARVVVTGWIPADALTSLEGHEVEVWPEGQAQTAEQRFAFVHGAEALLTLVSHNVDADLLDAAGTQLKIVANVGVGFNNIDLAACSARGVVATNTPDVLTDATADTALALVLEVTRRFGEGQRIIRDQRPWVFGLFGMLGVGLAGKRAGIVGPGSIGIATARRLRALGMEIAYAGRSPMRPAAAEELGAERVELDELLATSDVISLHVPYTSQTHHLIGAAQLAAMKPTAFLVNTARGAVVDEAALVEALRAGQVAGAGLDVYEHEPTVHPGLLELENVALYPHMGSATVETRMAMARLAAENAAAVLAGRPPLTEVRASGA